MGVGGGHIGVVPLYRVGLGHIGLGLGHIGLGLGCIGPVVGFIGLFPSIISIVGAIWGQEVLLGHIGPYGSGVGLYGAIWAWGGPYGAGPCRATLPGPLWVHTGPVWPGTGLYMPRTGPIRPHPIVKRRRAPPKPAPVDVDAGRPVRTGSAQFVRELRGRTFPR